MCSVSLCGLYTKWSATDVTRPVESTLSTHNTTVSDCCIGLDCNQPDAQIQHMLKRHKNSSQTWNGHRGGGAQQILVGVGGCRHADHHVLLRAVFPGQRHESARLHQAFNKPEALTLPDLLLSYCLCCSWENINVAAGFFKKKQIYEYLNCYCVNGIFLLKSPIKSSNFLLHFYAFNITFKINAVHNFFYFAHKNVISSYKRVLAVFSQNLHGHAQKMF